MKTRKTMLDKAINGRKVLAYVEGQFSPTAKNSNLYKAIICSGYTPDDIGTKIDIAVGARRQHRTEGYKMAVVEM